MPTAAITATQTQDVESRQTLREHLQEEVERTQAELDRRRADERRFLYADVETLINVGFLSHTLEVNGVTISLRSLNPGDMFLLRSRVAGSDLASVWKTWTVAASIWMVNGWNLLGEKNVVPMLHEIVLGFPRPVLDKMFYTTLGLFARVDMAVRRTEAYCYEHYSRSLWRFCGRQSPANPSISGIAGSETLGTNPVQRMWIAFNIGEDDRLQHRQAWMAAKLVASAQSPKGVRRINQTDENLERAEQRRRREAIAHMVNEAMYGEGYQEETGEMVVMVRGRPVVVPRVKTARSVEDLEEQMRMWVAGEKDFHDLVVENYKARIKAQFEEEKRQRERAGQELPQGVYGGTTVVGYTPEQMAELRPDLLKPAARKRVFDGSAPLAVYSKWLAQEPSPGKLAADEHGIQERGRQSLDERLAARQPRFSTTPIGSGKERGS